MMTQAAEISYLPNRMFAEPGRIVIRPFQIGPLPHNPEEAVGTRMDRIARAVLAMDDSTVANELEVVDRDFTNRHLETRNVYLQRFEQVRPRLGLDPDLAPERKELIGAYFCHEYSYASAALMNPSIVSHPDQTGLEPGDLRIVLSLRAVGEGHISSVLFREGIIHKDGGFTLVPQPPVSVAVRPTVWPTETNGFSTVAQRADDSALSGTVLFPITDQQRNGLEDLRLVRFTDPDGRVFYYGTYTAYNGFSIQSELLVTEDFRTFQLHPIVGAAARNKGMALFPRKVNGRYTMITREDGENLFFMQSDDLLHWEQGALLMAPQYPWELIQIGNCGSPIEIDEGWLLLTHGVGPMRKYAIGAVLLDKNDPSRIIGRTSVPLLTAQDEEREGYVPNVVYTCGALVLGDGAARKLFMPYGIADSSVAFCWVELSSLLQSLS